MTNFTQISNLVAQMPTSKLSNGALSLYVYMASLPTTWNFKISNIAKAKEMGVASVVKYLQELQNLGLITKTTRRGRNIGSEVIYSVVFEISKNEISKNEISKDEISKDEISKDEISNFEMHINNNKYKYLKEKETLEKETLEKETLEKETLQKSASADFECVNSAFENSTKTQSDLSVKKPKAKKANSASNITNAFNAHKDKIHHFTLDDVLEFAKHRDEIKKPITEMGAVKIIDKLIKLGIGAYDSIENSITNGWQGLFEPRKINFENSAFARERNRARGQLAKKYVTIGLNDRYYSDEDLEALNFQKSNTEDFNENN